MYCKLLSTINRDNLVLTPNRRLTQFLVQQYNQLQIENHKVTWETPTIYPLPLWMQSIAKVIIPPDKIMLSDIQEQILWRNILKKSSKELPHLQLHQASQLVKEAWQLLQGWNLKYQQLESYSENDRYFYQWAQEFEAQLHHQSWYSIAEIPSYIKQFIQRIAFPKRITLVGFDELNPSQLRLFDTIKKYTEVIFFEPPRHVAEVKKIAFCSPEAEWVAVAQWAKAEWQKNPKARIACLINNLPTHRTQIDTIFTRIFMPTYYLAGTEQPSLPFNITAGQSLSQHPLIGCAMDLLKCHPDRLKFEVFSPLLLSPFLNSGAHEAEIAAMLDVKLRDNSQWYCDIQKLICLLSDLQPYWPQATLPDRLKKWYQITQLDGCQYPSAWAIQWRNELNAIGWPGQLALDSISYQWFKRWESCLQQYATFNKLTSEIDRSEALSLLAVHIQQSIFQPRTNNRAPIQILGTLEAAGQLFDKMWITTLNESSWPSAARPNPFLPIALQRRYNMPHSSSQREMEYTLSLQQQLLNCSPQITVSYIEQIGDARQLPSPLIKDFPSLHSIAGQNSVDNVIQQQIFASAKIEIITDDKAMAVEGDEMIAGGSSVLQYQTECPFKAFGYIRLKTEVLKQPELGITAAEKGELLHHVLEIIWKTLKNQTRLLQLSKNQLDSLIDGSIDIALKKVQKNTIFIAAEQKRLKKIISNWIEKEKLRTDFSVQSHEFKQIIEIGKLSLKVKIDRIDKINGELLIIDYKSSKKNSPKQWLTDPMSSIQLPLYGITINENCKGIAFGYVTNQEQLVSGVSNSFSETDFLKISPVNKYSQFKTWKELTSFWKISINKLADDFINGFSAVKPQHKKFCDYCHLQKLCRINSKSEIQVYD